MNLFVIVSILGRLGVIHVCIFMLYLSQISLYMINVKSHINLCILE